MVFCTREGAPAEPAVGRPNDLLTSGLPARRMYEKFYGLRESPFNLTPDSRFLYLSTHHREALAALEYGVKERKGFTLLTGEIGSGKTTLSRALIRDLAEAEIRTALILDSYVDELELLQAIIQELNLESAGTGRRDLVETLNRFLVQEHTIGHTVAVIIDEAQNLTDSSLEQIRLLGNLETETAKLLQIVLVGQPELQTVLQNPKLEQLNQRIVVRYHLRALDADEVQPYIEHRLRVAGMDEPIEFTDTAIKLIYEYSKGIPRRINLLCDRALLAGYVASSRTIDEAIIRSAAMEVGADQWSKKVASGAGAGAEGGGLPVSPKLLYALLLIVLVAMVPVALVESGIFNRWFGARPDGGEDPGRPTTRTLPIPPLPTPEPTPVVLATPPPAPTPTPSPTPTPEPGPPVFRLQRPEPADPWTYDKDLVVRVDRVEFCRSAAILTVLAAWGIEVNLQDFRALTVEDAAQLDLVAANRDLGLRAVETKGGLARAAVYDVPAVVRVSDPEKRLSPYVALLEVTPQVCRVADPMMGMQQVPRSVFESFWRSAWVIYFDPENFETLQLGQRSESVRALQQALAELGHYRGLPTGEFDRPTVGAIEFLQRFYELFPTGRLDALTIMLITTHREPDRPRLVPEQGAEP